MATVHGKSEGIESEETYVIEADGRFFCDHRTNTVHARGHERVHAVFVPCTNSTRHSHSEPVQRRVCVPRMADLVCYRETVPNGKLNVIALPVALRKSVGCGMIWLPTVSSNGAAAALKFISREPVACGRLGATPLRSKRALFGTFGGADGPRRAAQLANRAGVVDELLSQMRVVFDHTQDWHSMVSSAPYDLAVSALQERECETCAVPFCLTHAAYLALLEGVALLVHARAPPGLLRVSGLRKNPDVNGLAGSCTGRLHRSRCRSGNGMLRLAFVQSGTQSPSLLIKPENLVWRTGPTAPVVVGHGAVFDDLEELQKMVVFQQGRIEDMSLALSSSVASHEQDLREATVEANLSCAFLTLARLRTERATARGDEAVAMLEHDDICCICLDAAATVASVHKSSDGSNSTRKCRNFCPRCARVQSASGQPCAMCTLAVERYVLPDGTSLPDSAVLSPTAIRRLVADVTPEDID